MSEQASRIDPSMLQTEAARVAAINYNLRLDVMEMQLRRLQYVLRDYFFYEDAYQLDLAEMAMNWAVASLASRDSNKDCETVFRAATDVMYLSTDDASSTLAPNEREQLHIAANALLRHYSPKVSEVLRTSFEVLRACAEDDPRRFVAEGLTRVRVSYINVARRGNLRDMICCCVRLCSALQASSYGVDTDIQTPLLSVLEVVRQISDFVFDWLEKGRLVVQDGKVIDPDADDDEDDDDEDEGG